MIQNLKNNRVALSYAMAASLVGYQIYRPATMEDRTPQHQTVERIESLKDSPLDFVHAQKPKIILGTVTNEDGSRVTPKQSLLVDKSFEEANQVLSSNCLEKKILETKFTETNGLTNPQIYDLFASKPAVTGVQFFYGDWKQNYIWKTMGYDQGDGIVYANTFFIRTPEALGSLSLHEGAHARNFHHYFRRLYGTSVPYRFNDFFDDCLGQN